MILIAIMPSMPFIFRKSLSAEQAKSKVFEHWKDLEAFAKKRFPDNENLANQALDFALEQLQDDDWKRVRQWESKGRFLTFLLTLTAHLITDYTRKQFGHHRAPKWLMEKSDQDWNKTYKLLIIQQYSRNEAIEILKASGLESSSIEQMVGEIVQKCKVKPQQPQFASEEEYQLLGSTDTEPLKVLGVSANELIEILLEILTCNEQFHPPEYLKEHFSRLQSSIQLDEEDRMFLYLRFVEGKSIKKIVKLLDLKGNPYKRLNKLTEYLLEACEEAGLMLDDTAK